MNFVMRPSGLDVYKIMNYACYIYDICNFPLILKWKIIIFYMFWLNILLKYLYDGVLNCEV